MHGPAFDGDDDGGQDGSQDGRGHAEDDDLAAQVGRRRQPDGLLAPEDAALPDQFADGQRGADDHRGDVECSQDLDGFVCVAGWTGRPGSRPDLPGISSASAPNANGRSIKKRKYTRLATKQTDLAAGHQPDLLAQGELGRGRPGPPPPAASWNRCLLPVQERAVGTLGIGADPREDLDQSAVPIADSICSGRPGESHRAGSE